MTDLIDAEFERIVELSMLEVECHILEAEATIATHERIDADTRLHVALEPDGRVATLMAECKAFVQAHPDVPCDVPDAGFRSWCIDVACYSWRRDYDEWPTLHNLSDRLAADVGISHSQAVRRIVAAVNDPSDRHDLYMVRQARLDEILNDSPPTAGAWVEHEAVETMRLYIPASAMTDGVQSSYERRCWRREFVA